VVRQGFVENLEKFRIDQLFRIHGTVNIREVSSF
jgi:hypothetical protein